MRNLAAGWMPEGKERLGGFPKADGILLWQKLVFDSQGFKTLPLNSKRGKKCFMLCKIRVIFWGKTTAYKM